VHTGSENKRQRRDSKRFRKRICKSSVVSETEDPKGLAEAFVHFLEEILTNPGGDLFTPLPLTEQRDYQ
jgi:hypothetical protein